MQCRLVGLKYYVINDGKTYYNDTPAQDLCRVCAREFSELKKNKSILFSETNLGVTLAKVVEERVEFGDGPPPHVCSICGSHIGSCRDAA